MQTRIDEIEDGIFRLSTFIPLAAGSGLSFNQFLVNDSEPLLFHCGQRSLFSSIREAVTKVLDPSGLRWITFSHVESDECGSLNDWLSVAPGAQAAHGKIGCNIWLNEMSDRPPRALADGEVIDLGKRKIRRMDTPHVPHNWDAGLMFEETTGTLFCSATNSAERISDEQTLMQLERQFFALKPDPSVAKELVQLTLEHQRTKHRSLVLLGRLGVAAMAAVEQRTAATPKLSGTRTDLDALGWSLDLLDRCNQNVEALMEDLPSLR